MHKLCMDCKYLVKDFLCDSPQNSQGLKPDYVKGIKDIRIPLWYVAQACREVETACGPEAKWFTPLEPTSNTVAEPQLEERCPDGPNY